MEVKLSYFRRDGKLRATGHMVTDSTDYNRVLKDVLRRSRLQNGLPGLTGWPTARPHSDRAGRMRAEADDRSAP